MQQPSSTADGGGDDDETEPTEPAELRPEEPTMVALGLLSEAVTFLFTSAPVEVVIIVVEVIVKLVIVVLQPAATVDVDVVD